MKLATIEKVLSKIDIEGADRIELITVLGWNIITKRNEFNIGDYCIYIPIDTTVNPDKEYFSFLKDPKNPESRIRIKTKKLKGVYSQGLVLPINVLNYSLEKLIVEGEDVSDIIDVQKYEKENIIVQQGCGTKFEPFPTQIISITDEDNLKTVHKCLEEFYNKEIYVTLKMDGSSMTIINNSNEFFVCSRRLILDEGSVMYQYVNNFKLKDVIINYNKNLAIQGEFCGPKINGNQMQLKNYDYYVFNIKDLDTNKYLGYEDIIKICSDLNIKTVPLLQRFFCDDSYTLQKFQDIANQVVYVTPMNKKVPAEGIVIRPIYPTYSVNINKMLSCKVINQNYKD
jgi:RNA ligase (TIGR02306 family)